MRKKRLTIIGCFALLFPCACQSAKSSLGDSYWKDLWSAGPFLDYITEHADEFDTNALKEEAVSQNSTLSQQFKATAILSALEYSNYHGEDSIFSFDYPDSAVYANDYLAKVNTEGATFWDSLTDAFYPYDCIDPIFAAADNLDGETLSNLLISLPNKANYSRRIKNNITKWIQANPVKIPEIYEDLTSIDFFNDWEYDDWKTTFFYDYSNPNHIKTDNISDAFAYMDYLHDSIIPRLDADFDIEELKNDSELDKESCYSSGLTVTIEGSLPLNDGEKTNNTATIDLANKKVAAFYKNPHVEEFKDSPPALQLLGDFMLELTPEEYPKTPEETDYYLILTPTYEYGEYYQDNSGNPTKIQQVNATTSIDLYDAKNGTLLTHVGNISELPPSTIFKDLSEESAQYPKITPSDVLTYIYRNINTPDAYISLLDNTAGLDADLAKEDPVILGSWEITFHSYLTTGEFDEGIFRYTPSDGCRFLRGEFTVKNVGTKRDTFLPMIYYIDEDPIIQITDADRAEFYDCSNALSIGRCLNGTSLEPGESEDGELIFEIPEEFLGSGKSLYAAASLGNKKVYFALD